MTRSVEIPEAAVEAAYGALTGDIDEAKVRAVLEAALPYLAPAEPEHYNDEGALSPDQPVRTGGVDPDIAPVEVPDAAPAGDGGLRYALEALCDYAEANTPDRRPRDKFGPIGRKPEPRLTVDEVRKLLVLHAPASAVPQPAHLPNRWGETVEVSEEDLQAAAEQSDDWGDGLPAPIGSVVPQPVDREALSAAVYEKASAVVLEGGYITTLIAPEDAVAAVLAVLAGEQEQVEK